MAEPGAAISYKSYDGAQLVRYPWQGRQVALLTESDLLDRSVMSRLLDALDRAFDVYASLTGREPSTFKN